MHHARQLLPFAAAIALVACGGGGDTDTAQATPVAPNEVTYTAVDFGFDGPAEIPAGETRFRLVSSGAELHHLMIVKLAEGKTFDSLMNAMKNPGPPPAWATFVGGPNPPVPGGESNGTLNMEPGNYALICVVDTPDKVPHVAKGMSRPLTVTPAASTAPVALPAPTITVTFSEYAFSADKPFTAGKHTIRVVNKGAEPHELVLIKLEPGKTLEDLGAWMQTMAGPPPGAPLGGAAPLSRDKEMQFDVDIDAGNYLLVCFVPDPTGQKLHVEHGMVQAFAIQ